LLALVTRSADTTQLKREELWLHSAAASLYATARVFGRVCACACACACVCVCVRAVSDVT